MKKIFLSFLLTIIFFDAFSQVSLLYGYITTKEGKPVSEASIKLIGSSMATMSNAEGKYEFRGVPFGKQKFEVTSVEVNKEQFTTTVNQANQRFDMAVQDKGVVGIEEVTVSRNTEKRDMEIGGFAVAVIETKEASLRNLTTNELLDRTVGVRVRQNGGEGSPIDYNLNGMSGSTIGIFLDGIAISTYGSSFNLNNIPPAMIERIEVYKGVLPAHLSGNYIGGAINVIMKKDASANNITASVSYGSFNTYRADVGGLYRNQNNGFTVRASGFFSHSDNDYEMWGKFSKYTLPTQRVQRYYRTKRANDKFETIGGRFEFGFTDVKWADQFFIGYNISDTYKEVPHGITMTKPYVGRFNEYQAHVLSLNYIKKDFLLPGVGLNVNAVHSMRSTYLQDTVSQPYNWDGTVIMAPPNQDGISKPFPHVPGRGQQGDAVITDIDRTISNIRSNLSYDITKRHRVSLNHVFENSKRDDQDLLNPDRSRWITNNQIITNIFALNYESEWFDAKLRSNIFGKYSSVKSIQLAPQNEVAGVINYLRTTNTRDNQGFGGALSYQFIRDGFLLLSAEKAFVVPTDRQIFGEPEANLLPNPDIQTEVSVNYNLGARYQIANNERHRVSLYANAFWRNGYDKIIQQTRTDPVIEGRENQVEDIQVTQFVNLPRTQSIGFEAEVNYVFDNRLNAVVNFSKFNSLFKVETDERGNPHSLYDLQVPNEPFFTVNGNLQYRFDNVLQRKSILNMYYNTGYVAPFSTIWIESEWFTTPAQFSHDFGVSYGFPNRKLIISLDGKNLFNAEVYDNFGVQKPGRAFYIKLNYTINNFNKS
ncbi:TonB-dependent receptor [Sphingobacterium paludis]|uniref:Outer membrane receptor protein involved in Fe transport n=1 Tax=Sphingobacterium paludis TaxID=1476465 RepID=A0A4R7D3E0_9SPHI|nr:TonB-dependent receptor plug domain-containing protein [Sphingobacterium paludis]TDS14641.1 outer membrane receptor protein involved in Fe transport [Sphingobacterium paludis]